MLPLCKVFIVKFEWREGSVASFVKWKGSQCLYCEKGGINDSDKVNKLDFKIMSLLDWKREYDFCIYSK